MGRLRSQSAESCEHGGRLWIHTAGGKLRRGEVDVVIAYAVDRLSRNQNHIGVLFDEIEQAGARLEFVTERFEDTAIGRFMPAARAFTAEVVATTTRSTSRCARSTYGSQLRVEGCCRALPASNCRDQTQASRRQQSRRKSAVPAKLRRFPLVSSK